MKITRYIVGTIGFLLVWFVVAMVLGWVMVLVFPPSYGGQAVVGIGFDWRSLPGTILGFLAGLQSFRASIRDRKRKGVRDD